jgi:hypothetical protein
VGRQCCGDYCSGVFLATFVWSIFIGATALLYLPSKTITTVFGWLLGISLSELQSGVGLITAANQTVSAISNELGALTSGPSTFD